MKINIIAVGKTNAEFSASYDYYLKMIAKYVPVNVVEVREESIPLKENEGDIKSGLEGEGEAILKRIKDKEFVFVFSPNGKKLDSIAFSRELEVAFSLGQSQVTFVIGSSNGLSAKVYARANLILSFSDLTFPHQLFRVMLLEQIFRAFKILRNERYHK